ncbi:MAG: hypothetical protein D6814_11905, partial [Calditrichaeota bacterium]
MLGWSAIYLWIGFGCQGNPGAPVVEQKPPVLEQKPVVRVAGTLQTPTLWEAKNQYVVTGDITVPRGVTLKIQGGTEVKFDGFYQLIIDGGLLLEGTAESPVLFSSNKTEPRT